MEIQELLGVNKDELLELIVKNITDQIYKQDDQMYDQVLTKTKQFIVNRINIDVNDMANISVLPRVDEIMRDLLIQRTNEFGEKKGQSLTLTEYLVTCCTNYMQENVDTQGKTFEENKRLGYSGRIYNHTRLEFLIDKNIQHAVNTAIVDAVKDTSSIISQSISDSVKNSLQTMLDGLKITLPKG